jgi:hemin uptake protein HemP
MTDHVEITTETPPVEEVAEQSAVKHDVWLSEELLEGRTEVLIRHGNETYRLRRTRQDKLILYK